MSDHRVCFIGDSFVQGTGDPERLGWTGRVLRTPAWREVTGYNLGVRRDTSADIARRWQAECAARLPYGIDSAGVVFHFGTNDTTVENGALRHLPQGGGGDIATREHFRDFELEFEWKVAAGSPVS